jgi:hypothetical protein
LDLDDDLDEDPARISPDTRALSLDLVGLLDLAAPFSRSRRISTTISPDLVGSRPKKKKKKTEEEKNRYRYVLFLYFFFFKKKKKFLTLATCVRSMWLKIYNFSLFFKRNKNTFSHLKIARG